MSKPLTIQYTGKYANHLLREKEKEIERLGNELQVQIEDNVRINEYIEEKEKEIKRLNNIINELDKYLDLKRKSYIEGFKWSGLEIIDQTKDFLQELKGSDKE